MPEKKEFWFSVYTTDSSFFSYINKRAKEFRSRNEYIRRLVEMDRQGYVAWDFDLQRDSLVEKLEEIAKAISNALGVEVLPERIQEIPEISPEVSGDELLEYLTKEKIL